MSNDHSIVRIGVIGLGEIAQVSHINLLLNLPHLFKITFLCDVSEQLLSHLARKVPHAKLTKDAHELCSSDDVDAVLICSATPFHPEQCISALGNCKWVLVEKPIAVSYRDLDAVIEAEKKAGGAKVFVGYQRRYAEALADAIEEVKGCKIDYMRVRDIIGPNSHLVAQSGTFPIKGNDIEQKDIDSMQQKDKEITAQALETEFGVSVTEENTKILSLLGGLGSHDLSAMREAVGMPQKVLGASMHLPIWTVLFQYEGFPVTYESGLNDLHLFDAGIEIFTQDKIVKVQYDTPYIKGLPVTMSIKEKVKGVKSNGFQERIVRKTYEDPYTLEFLDFHKCVTTGATPKTNATDAREELDLFKMIMQKKAEDEGGKA